MVEQEQIEVLRAQQLQSLLTMAGLADRHRPVGGQCTQQLLARHVGVVADQ
jgi:hypothetical protein